MKKLLTLAAVAAGMMAFGSSTAKADDDDGWRGGRGYRSYGYSYGGGGWGRGRGYNGDDCHHRHGYGYRYDNRPYRYGYGRPAYRSGVVIVTPGFGFSYGGW
jgi:hypothetical protein